MSEIKWIKLSTNMFDDEKIKLIRTMPEGDSIALIWVQILCLAGKINDGGLVYMGQNLAYSDEMLATILGHPVSTMRIALSALEQFNMISVAPDQTIDVLNWTKHQSTDKMAQVKEQNRIRQQRYYYRNQLRSLGYEEADIPDDLEQLKSMVEEPNVNLTLANATEVRSKKLEVRSKKLEVNNTPSVPESELKSDFEKLWVLYPNKKGKQKAYTAYKKSIKDGTSNKEIQNGIVSYTKEIEIKRTEPNFIAHGSTWFANQRWEDDYQTSTKPQSFGLPDAPDKFQVKQEDIDAFEQMMGRKVTAEELEAMKGG